MSKNSQHIVPRKDGKWGVKKAGSNKASRVYENKKDAIRAGTNIAKNQRVELFIHGKNGKIRDKRSYGKDPYPPKDKN